MHGTLTGLDLSARTVAVKRDDGSPLTEPYDALRPRVPVPARSIERVLMPWIVRRGIYRGVRDDDWG